MYVLVFIVKFAVIQMVVALSKPKIAIIGAGIGGTTCSYYLKQLFAGNASISLFERDIIGGRLSTINVVGEYYESGGSVIHPRNKYVHDFSTLLGLKPRPPFRNLWGIYNGEKMVFQDSEWSIVTLINLYWRYGWDLLRLSSVISSLLDNFSRIYTAQDQGLSFTSVNALLSYMSPKFPNMTQYSLEAFLKEHSFSERFIKELVQAVSLVNYGQTTDMSAFAGAVSLAGSDSGLWCIHGGNNQIPISLLDRINIRVVSGEVSDIKLLKSGSFLLTYRRNPPKNAISEEYDFVVIAAPLATGLKTIEFHDFPRDLSKYEQPYHRTVSTFVYGTLKPIAFQTDSIPDTIFTNNDSLPFNSVSVSFPISGSERKINSKVYKIFSKMPLTEDQVKFMFDDIHSVKLKDWHAAYPHYTPPESIPPFVLHPGLYYLNSIEQAASAMEMSVISARNIALLIHNYWNNKLVSIDPVKRMLKEEL